MNKTTKCQENMTYKEYRERIMDEIKYQDYKWGKQDHSDNKWLVILMEEVGETAQAINQGDTTKAKTELIQVAAVIESWLVKDPDETEDGKSD